MLEAEVQVAPGAEVARAEPVVAEVAGSGGTTQSAAAAPGGAP